MIVFVNFGGPGGQHPLVAVALLFAGLAFNSFLSSLLGLVTSSLTGEGSALELGLSLAILTALAAGGVALVRWSWTPTGRQRLQQLFAPPAARGQGQGQGQQQRQQQQDPASAAQRRQQRWERVVEVLHGLPTETVASKEELAGLPVHELKQRLSDAGISSGDCREKTELVARLLEAGGSSGDSCCICCEDYVSGDVVRRLPCSHRMHLVCLDRWLLTSASDYSRPPACPMCNSELPA